jgi:hypothetical protein
VITGRLLGQSGWRFTSQEAWPVAGTRFELWKRLLRFEFLLGPPLNHSPVFTLATAARVWRPVFASSIQTAFRQALRQCRHAAGH